MGARANSLGGAAVFWLALLAPTTAAGQDALVEADGPASHSAGAPTASKSAPAGAPTTSALAPNPMPASATGAASFETGSADPLVEVDSSVLLADGSEKAFTDLLKKHADTITGGLSGGYDKGFFLKTSKGPFDLKFNFLLQVWYDAIENDPTYPPLNAASLYPSDGDSFILRRGELKFSGRLTKCVTWVVMIDPARAIGGRSPPLVIGAPTEAFLVNKRILQDLYIDYALLTAEHCCWLVDSMSLRVGQFKAPQTDDGQRSSSIQEFPEKSFIGFLFGDTRSAGAMLFGTLWEKRLLYQAAVFNGNGRNVFRDESDDKDVVARLELHPFAPLLERHAKWAKEVKAQTGGEPEPFPLRKLAVGVAGGVGENGRAASTFHQDSFGTEFEIEYLDYFFRSEWFRGKPLGSNLATFPTSAAPQVQGWYVLAGADLGADWQAAVRYQEFDPSEDLPGDMVDVTTLGLTYFLGPHDATHHGAKIQAAYNFNNIHATAPATPTGFLADGDEFTLVFQVNY